MVAPSTCAQMPKRRVTKTALAEHHPTVFIIDDDPEQREVLSRLLSLANYKTETFASAHEFLARERFSGIGCVLLDIVMPEVSGQELHKELKHLDSTMPVIFVTGHQDVSACVEAMKNGALDVLTKPVARVALLSAVSSAISRHSSEMKRRRERSAARKRLSALTDRERDVLRLVIIGQRNLQIAAKLGIVEKTVKIHRARVMKKSKARSAIDLLRLAECAEAR